MVTLQVVLSLEMSGFSYEISPIYPRGNFSRRILLPYISPALYTFGNGSSAFSRQPFIMALFSDLIHRVHTCILVRLPSITTVFRCILADQRLRVRRFEWLTLFPDCPDFGQYWHRAMLTTYLRLNYTAKNRRKLTFRP